jgi:hypothetical protein
MILNPMKSIYLENDRSLKEMHTTFHTCTEDRKWPFSTYY